MATATKKPTTVDEYIAQFPADVQAKLQKIRKTVKTLAPKAEEMISYGIIGYKYHGMLIYLSGWKEHISLYPAPRLHAEFKKELANYKGGKGTVQFPLDEPLPFDLIKRIIDFRKKENETAFAAKAVKKSTAKKATKKKAITKK